MRRRRYIASALAIGILMAVPFTGCNDDVAESALEPPDVEAYFEARGDISSVTPVADSDSTQTEQEVIGFLADRGFTEYAVTTDYSYDGEYYRPYEISDSSTDMHPIYQSYYVNSRGELWALIVIDGCLMATPASRNVNSPDLVPVVVSESSEIVSYDSTTNSYYRTVPDDSVMVVREVDEINAGTLDLITVEVLNHG